jgi:L-gulonate 5-dehydrogenase
MRAAVFDAPGALRLEARAAPEPGPGEARVALRAAGVCAGDLSIFQGRNPYVTFPRVGGHEIAGVVEALGPATDGPAPGTLVAVEPFIGCGRCHACRVGRPNCCVRLTIIGVHRDGGFADRLIAPVAKLVTAPAGLSPYEVAFAEPVAIGVQACRRGAIGPGDVVLVLGAGPIGLAVIEVARARGAEVFVSDPAEARTAVAERLGATALPAGPALAAAVADRTDGDGMPVVVEAAGPVPAMEAAFELVAAGGRVVILGIVKRGQAAAIPALDLTRKEMTILGSRASADCFPEALGLIAAGRIRYPAIGSRFDLAEAPAVFARLDADPGALHKAVFVTEPA